MLRSRDELTWTHLNYQACRFTAHAMECESLVAPLCEGGLAALLGVV